MRYRDACQAVSSRVALQELCDKGAAVLGHHVDGDQHLPLDGDRFPEASLRGLEARGHVLTRWPAWSELAGHAQGIELRPGTGTRMGAADPRLDGAALGS